MFEATLVYRLSSRTTRAIQRNPVWKNKQTKNVSWNMIENKAFFCTHILRLQLAGRQLQQPIMMAFKIMFFFLFLEIDNMRKVSYFYNLHCILKINIYREK